MVDLQRVLRVLKRERLLDDALAVSPELFDEELARLVMALPEYFFDRVTCFPYSGCA